MKVYRSGLLVVFFLVAGASLHAMTAVVFVSRALNTMNDIQQRTGVVERAASGKLIYLDQQLGTRVLVDSQAPGAPASTPTDVMDPDASYDGERIVFAGYSQTEGGWRIFQVKVDGSGLRQLTTSNRQLDAARYGEAAPQLQGHDDLDPCYLPDGRICFVSTRYPGIAPDNRLRSTNLFVMNADGANLHRITSERFGADTPTVNPSTGQVVYSRWWRTGQVENSPSEPPPEPIPPGSPGYGGNPDSTNGIFNSISPSVLRGVDESEFPGVNSWFLSQVNPDGTDLAMFTGFRLDRGLTQAYRPSFLPSGEVLALFIPKTPFFGFPRGNGLRVYRPGPGVPEALGGPQNFDGSPLGQGGVVFPPANGGGAFRFLFASAAALPDGRLLVSAAAIERPQYDIYIMRRDASLMTRIVETPDADLDAAPVMVRPLPPVIADRRPGTMLDETPRSVEEAFREGGSFTFTVENIHANAAVDTPIASAPPIGKDLAIEFYMAPQRTHTQSADPPTLIRREVIGASGKVEVELPAGVPLFEVLRRPDGTLAQGRDGQIFHVGGMNFSRAGEHARCVGCHAGHSMMAVPEDASWTNLASSAVVTAEPTSGLPIDGNIPGEDPAAGQAMPPVPVPGQVPALFGPQNLVDRRTDVLSEWVGAIENREPSIVTLRWSVPVLAREVVVYGPAPGQGIFGPRETQIRGFTLTTLRNGTVQQEIAVRETILIDRQGHRTSLDPGRSFDTLKLTIRPEDVSGQFEFSRGPALAEIEVSAQVDPSGGAPTASFLRGDTNCDGSQNISDAVGILDRLFQAGARMCCEAAADANADQNLDITDPIFILNFLFLRGRSMPFPSEGCGRASAGNLVCDFESCP